MLLDEIRSIQSSRKDLIGFGLTLGLFLILIAVILLWQGKAFPRMLFSFGLVLVLAALCAPSFLKPLQKAWMALALLMGWVMTRVVLGLLFYLVLFPIGLLAKVSGKRFLDLEKDESAPTYWNHREGGFPSAQDYERQF